MKCSIMDLQEKFVINGLTGNRIGYVTDVELDTELAKLNALIVNVKSKNNLFGKGDKIRIDWADIKVIGSDSIIVNSCKDYEQPNHQKNLLEKFWN